MPKVSVIMAYWNRIPQFRVTLQSYEHFYKGLDIELLVGDDTPRNQSGIVSELLGHFPFKFKVVEFDRSGNPFRNPAVILNTMAREAQSDILHLTCPEVMHCGDLMRHALENIDDRTYLVYGCRTLRPTKYDSFYQYFGDIENCTNWHEAYGWYQHTEKFNRLLHFASFIKKTDFDSVGGFCELYDGGVGYEDNDLLETILKSGMTVRAFDEPYSAHQYHDRTHWIDTNNGVHINDALFHRRWGYPPRIHPPGGLYRAT